MPLINAVSGTTKGRLFFISIIKNATSKQVWRTGVMVAEADAEKAPFVRTEALPICPDCTWPPRDFPKNIVRTSIAGLIFRQKNVAGSGVK